MSYPVPVEVRRHTSHPGGWTYAQLDLRQREIAERVLAGGLGAVLLSELAPVITQGRRAPTSDITLSAEALARVGIDLYEADRGGLATYHGPGQWVLFVVDRLERLTGDPRGVRNAVDRLLAIGREVAQGQGLSAEVRSGAELGVWTPQGKCAAVGVHIFQGVLLHGVAVNALRTPTSFVGLRPCGLDAPVDFLLENNASDAEFESLGKAVIDSTFRHFYH